MHSFTDLGFSFAIDDVGAGYSGLETVAVLKPAYLKIDIALVRDVHQKKVSQQVVKAILDMGDGLGATVIAEGIQAREEADALRELGVHLGPGLLLRPAGGPLRRAPRGPGEAERGPLALAVGPRAPPPRRASSPRCGGSGGSPSSGTPLAHADRRSRSSNPCTAALAATGGVAASAAGRSPKSDGYGHDDRDPREFLGAPPPAAGRRRLRPRGLVLRGEVRRHRGPERRRLDHHRREPLRPRRGRPPLRAQRPGRLRRAARRAAASAPTSAGGWSLGRRRHERGDASPSPSPSTARLARPPSSTPTAT